MGGAARVAVCAGEWVITLQQKLTCGRDNQAARHNTGSAMQQQGSSDSHQSVHELALEA